MLSKTARLGYLGAHENRRIFGVGLAHAGLLFFRWGFEVWIGILQKLSLQ